MAVLFGVLAILFGLCYVVGMGIELFDKFDFFGSVDTDAGELLLGPMGLPWSEWFREQLGLYSAPVPTLLILIFLAYVSKSTNR